MKAKKLVAVGLWDAEILQIPRQEQTVEKM